MEWCYSNGVIPSNIADQRNTIENSRQCYPTKMLIISLAIVYTQYQTIRPFDTFLNKFHLLSSNYKYTNIFFCFHSILWFSFNQINWLYDLNKYTHWVGIESHSTLLARNHFYGAHNQFMKKVEVRNSWVLPELLIYVFHWIIIVVFVIPSVSAPSKQLRKWDFATHAKYVGHVNINSYRWIGEKLIILQC